MKEINVLSYGGGKQSTALLLLSLEQKQINVDFDYIIFADTKNESKLLYHQLFEIQKYVKEHYNKDIIITSNNKEILNDVDAIKLIKNHGKYRYSEYDDLYQSHLLYFKGEIEHINVMPLWIRKSNGKIGKTPFKTCTNYYKINAIYRELRHQLNIKQFRNIKINMYIGYSVDELSRVKPNPLTYVENIFPLVDLNMTKNDCSEYVKNKLGFVPISSVCNMCYANDFNRVYTLYKNDKEEWDKLIVLDNAMNDKPKNHKIKNDVYMFRFQSLIGKRLKDLDMEELKKTHKNDMTYKLEQEMACIGGCFL